jgi:hypothetical protein
MSAEGRANVAAGMNGGPGDFSRSRIFLGGTWGSPKSSKHILNMVVFTTETDGSEGQLHFKKPTLEDMTQSIKEL